MKRFVEGMDRRQITLFPDCLEDWICEDNPVRVIDVFVDGLDLAELRFGGVEPEVTGRPSYHPSVLLKLYIYGYLNRVQLSRRLEREAAGYVALIIAYRNGAPVRLGDVATVVDSVQNDKLANWYNGKRAITIGIFRQADANTVEVVKQIKAAIRLRAPIWKAPSACRRQVHLPFSLYCLNPALFFPAMIHADTILSITSCPRMVFQTGLQ